MSVNHFNAANYLTDAQVDQWIKEERARVKYRHESRVD
jgi:hypothetical protein